jgi:uncharacterized protein YbjT (DUF2867 family)
MARIVIIGGHGKVALLLSRLLTSRGDEVTSVIRSDAQLADVQATGATPLLADLESSTIEDLATILSGHVAVVWSAGAGGGSAERTYAVDRDAAIRSMEAAEAAGVLRYVMVSFLQATPEHRVPADDPFHAYSEAKIAADDRLRGSRLDWTILGPGVLVSTPGTGLIEVGEGLERGSVTREDVAAVAAAVLELPSTAGRFIGFTNGTVPIGQVLGA